MDIHRKSYRAVVYLLTVVLVLVLAVPGAWGSSAGLYNDRAAQIINAGAFSGSDFLIPEGLSGKGQIIGIADSGLDKGSTGDIHPDLQSKSGEMPRVAMLNSYSGREVPDDPVGHGTHMAATIAGSGAASAGKYRGIAPEASLYFQALLDADGVVQIPENIEDLFLPAYDAGVRVHVDGWGREGNRYSGISAGIDRFVFEHPDFLPLFGAGNSGPAPSTLSCEANAKNALVIGSSQVPRPALDPASRFADQVTESSSSGPAGDGRIKPDLLAPGSAVISACSSLVESNFAANEMYRVMGGSSMATAVTGGAAALLREYMSKEMNKKSPSAALIKALLVNGARQAGEKQSAQSGFGILDLAGTILPLAENSLVIKDESGIQEAEVEEYRFTVENPAGDFRATLAWTDPPAKSGAETALVNNLDLLVKDPAGNIYYGNDFNKRSQADTVNNIEQIVIPDAPAGEYVIRVKAKDIAGSHNSQKYALVYGQSLCQETITGINETDILLADGSSITRARIEGKITMAGEHLVSLDYLRSGSQLYLAPGGHAYIFSSKWEADGAQMISTPEGEVLVEARNEIRDGGYYVDQRGDSSRAGIRVNEQVLADPALFPIGAEVKATVNPVYQTLWDIVAVYEEIEGYIARVDADNRIIRLLNDVNEYHISDTAAGSYTSKLVDSSAVDAPYGYGEKIRLESLLPGMKVTLVLSPNTNLVNYVRVERELVIGTIADIYSTTDSIRMDTGHLYNVFPGTIIRKNGVEVDDAELEAGDHLTGLLLPGTSDLLQINVDSHIWYARIIYYNRDQRLLYFMDSSNNIRQCSLEESSGIYARGIPTDTTSLVSGKWIRISCGDDEQVLRVDIAGEAEEEELRLASFDPELKILTMADGSIFRCESETLVSKGGYRIYPEDFVPGEILKISTLSAQSPFGAVLAAAESLNQAVLDPSLQVTVRSLNGVLIVKGRTDGDYVSIYRQDGSRSVIKPFGNREFSGIYKMLDNEDMVKVRAFTRKGGIAGADSPVIAYEVQENLNTFDDIQGHRGQEAIEKMLADEVIQGYDDGTFRPDNPVSRVELLKMISAYMKWIPSGANGAVFTDYNDIPWWGLGGVSAAVQYGIIQGYPDGSFRPGNYISSSEMAVIMDRLYRVVDSTEEETHAGFMPSGEIPLWAEPAVSRGYERGILQRAWTGGFNPDRPVSRAEVALLLIGIRSEE